MYLCRISYWKFLQWNILLQVSRCITVFDIDKIFHRVQSLVNNVFKIEYKQEPNSKQTIETWNKNELPYIALLVIMRFEKKFYEMINFICIESNDGQYYDKRTINMTSITLMLNINIYSSSNAHIECIHYKLAFVFQSIVKMTVCCLWIHNWLRLLHKCR